MGYDEVAAKIALALLIGLLVGLEREWAQKEVGLRTFASISLLGALASMLGTAIVAVMLLGVYLSVVLLNIHSLLKDRSLELTTSTAMVVVAMLGALAGQGHFFTAATTAIVLTILLASKVELSHFADALNLAEIRGAVLFGLLTFVILPLLPDRFVDPYGLINLHDAWITVIAIAGIGFANYILLRFYSTRGMYYAALLGGLVNSTATVSELSSLLRAQAGTNSTGAAALLQLTNVAMFARNLALLAIFAPSALRTASAPLVSMAAVASLLTWYAPRMQGLEGKGLHLSSPMSLLRVLRFGGLFVVLAVVGTLTQRHFGELGFLAVSAIGGVISSASTTATAASLAALGRISPETAGLATLATGAASAVVNIPLVYQQTRSVALMQKLTLTTTAILGTGLLVGVLNWYVLRP
jgi:uncharacterized membrane protein (DUF4010 family)